jgi:hypothetical protein
VASCVMHQLMCCTLYRVMVKKYFILLIIILPLSRLGAPLTMILGRKFVESFHLSLTYYANNYEHLVDSIDMIFFYFITSILGIIVFIDLKKNWKLIGIPILTILNPGIGVILFLLRDFYLNQKNNEND